MMSIQANVDRLRQELEEIRSEFSIDYPVRILAVTKTRSAQEVRQVIDTGIPFIGENRVQEAELKFAELGEIAIIKRLIGHLQENKANKAATLFDTVDSLDSLKTARKLNNKCAELSKKMEVLIEVNTSGESSKNGLEPEEVPAFIQEVSDLDHLLIKGFMTIGPLGGDESANRAAFRLLHGIRDKMREQFPELDLQELSMGMSGDYRLAVEEGATMIRPGTLLFGSRNY